jgi:GntR family transcriptional regulator / MocR family aminotransferase
MRRAQGALLPPLGSARRRRADIYRTLRAAILDGVLAAGERLPSTRHAAEDYGVSRGVLEEVFSDLADEGFLRRAVGRGTYVAAAVARLQPPARGHERDVRPSRRGAEVATNARCREPEVLRPFNAGVADTSEFPRLVWQQLSARAARELGPAALGFADPRGLPALRAAIARYLAQVRGLRCTASQVVVFSSAQQAIHALAILLVDRGADVWLEDPCYLGARAALELADARVVPVPVDADGLRVDVGERRAPTARLAYVTPSHQYPTGVALALERRLALLAWAARRKAWIVEDDYDGELRYAGQPLTALHALDASGRVVYVGTLNKVMFVALRLAYAVVPETLVEPLANVRTQLDGFTPAVTQMAASMFLDEGHLASHLRRMRAVYGAKRDALVGALAPLAARGWTWSTNPVGLHLLVAHRDGERVRTIARRSALELATLGPYRTARHRDDGLLLRFGGLDAAQLRSGIATLLAELR